MTFEKKFVDVLYSDFASSSISDRVNCRRFVALSCWKWNYCRRLLTTKL